ncbi:PREDICTED: uncharacterized protein LOC18599442 [Theobroma cacao]|uniref:Uncharacterized protein LOC18599442 n=1 Tax=Theobroma cacao TaxID=3641 RepID=A0AB32WCR4_THECC|nr:PREDICTED: uncharacterized protein LOC18599442 [Theobroma cacao]
MEWLLSDDPIETTESHDISDWLILVRGARVSSPIREGLNVHSGEQLRLLTKNLRQVIKHEVKMVKEKEEYQILYPTPISYHVSPEHISLSQKVGSSAQQEKKEKRAKATLVGRNNTSFKLPDECIAHAMKFEEEKLQKLKDQKDKVCQYSLFERLEGWRIDRKKRPYGVNFDMYFEHEKSKAKFRSVTEVIKFILHGAYPKNKQNSKQGKLEERSGGSSFGVKQTVGALINGAIQNLFNINVGKNANLLDFLFQLPSKQPTRKYGSMICSTLWVCLGLRALHLLDPCGYF